MFDVSSISRCLLLLSYGTSTSSRTGTDINISKYQGIAKVHLSIGALTGTPQISWRIEHSETGSSNWNTVVTYPTVTTPNVEVEQLLDIRGLRPFIRGVTICAGITATNYGMFIHLPRPSNEPAG